MRITVGSTLLGDYEEEIFVGGFVAAASSDTQKGRGTCHGLARLRARGNTVASFNVPLHRTFSTVSEAQKWIADTAKAGAVEGRLLFSFADGTQTAFPWAVAKPTGMKHKGVLVSAQWSIEAGERLT